MTISNDEGINNPWNNMAKRYRKDTINNIFVENEYRSYHVFAILCLLCKTKEDNGIGPLVLNVLE